jgi:divalent metal cation (Fe/Co/Zn/Cd) transporter
MIYGPGGERSLVAWLKDAAVGVLAACVALYMAARLIEAVWVTLTVVGVVVGAVAITIALVRWRTRRW